MNAKIVLHIEIDWEFDTSELSNLFDDAIIILPGGNIISNTAEAPNSIICESIIKEGK